MEVDYAYSRAYESWPVIPAAVVNPANGERVDINVVVDTGAEATILDRSVAEVLGLDLGGRSVRVSGLGSSAVAPVSDVDIIPLGEPSLRVRVSAAFIPGIGQDLGNLLGLDYFSHVNLGLSHANRVLYFGLPG